MIKVNVVKIHPIIKERPPKGVIGPSHTKEKEIRLLNDNRKMLPEKTIVPHNIR